MCAIQDLLNCIPETVESTKFLSHKFWLGNPSSLYFAAYDMISAGTYDHHPAQ